MKKNKCIFCGKDEFLFLYNARDINQPSAEFQEIFKVLKCKNCGLVYTDAKINNFEKFYKEEFRDKTGKRFHGIFEKVVNHIEKKRVNKLLKYKKNGRILDVGCGRSIFLKELKKRGWDVYGIEIFEENVNFLKKEYNIQMFNGDFCKIDLPEKFFDVVAFWHVFEHVQNPLEALNKIKRILKDDGIVIMELPNIDSAQAKIFKENWFHLDVPRHIYHYSPNNLCPQIQKCGFSILKIQGGENFYNLFGFFQSVLNKLGNKSDVFNIMKKNQQHKGLQSYIKFINILFSYIVLTIPMFVFCFLENSLKKWGVFEVYFKNKSNGDEQCITNKK